jgi:hypothetical protein
MSNDGRPVGDTAVVAAASHDTLAGVYDWLVPEALLTPPGSAAFGDVVGELAPGARALDCTAGTGLVAVGLVLRGLDVVATDASGAMIERTRRLASEHGARAGSRGAYVGAARRAGWDGSFHAVLRVGNSLTHASGRAARRTAQKLPLAADDVVEAPLEVVAPAAGVVRRRPARQRPPARRRSRCSAVSSPRPAGSRSLSKIATSLLHPASGAAPLRTS